MIEVKNLSKTFSHQSKMVYAIQDISFTLQTGKSLAICGSSGAGKTTLLNLLGGLDAPSAGEVLIDGKNMDSLSDKEEARFRNQNLGFVFQFHHLLQDFSILENIMMPLLIAGVKAKEAKKRALLVMDSVGIAQTAERSAAELSGGEQQRAAIARAIVHKPRYIFADEPTGNLDENNAEIVFDLLCKLNRDLEATLILVTHNQDFAKKLNHIIVLESGRLQADKI